MCDVLLPLGRLDEAEKVLLQMWADVELEAQVPESTRKEIAQRFATLYVEWDMPEKATEWRAKLPVKQEAVASDQPATAGEKPGE